MVGGPRDVLSLQYLKPQALKQRWNDMADPLKEPKEVNRLMETLEDGIGAFLVVLPEVLVDFCFGG